MLVTILMLNSEKFQSSTFCLFHLFYSHLRNTSFVYVGTHLTTFHFPHFLVFVSLPFVMFFGQFFVHACMLAQLCPALCNHVNCSPPGFSVQGIFQARILGVGYHFFLQGIVLTQDSNQHLLHWQLDSLPLSYLGSPQFFQLYLFYF